MPRPLSRAQRDQNHRFLAALRETGNVRLAARELGLNRSTFTKRRAKHPAFAADWDAALQSAHARFKLAGGERPPEGVPACNAVEGPAAKRRVRSGQAGPARPSRPEAASVRTKGGELHVTRSGKSGRLQLRRAPPGRMTAAAEQLFLQALSASANVRLSAAAAGFAHSSFYARKRTTCVFATEMETALSIGYDRLEAAALQAGLAAMRGDGKTSAWQVRSAGTPLPPMNWDQAFQLLCMHQRTQRLGWEHRTKRLRSIEFDDAMRMLDRALKADERSMHFALTGSWRLPREQAPPELPQLHLVTGWSRADPNRVKHNPNLALFGGWRIGDIERNRRGSG